MRLFQLNADYAVVCEFVSTRSGFKHVATLLFKGEEIDSTKICYSNRTWERFTYASVLWKLIDKHFKSPEREEFMDAVGV